MYAVVAVAIGMLVGLATGGRFRHVGEKVFRSVWLLIVGVVLQGVVEVAHLSSHAGQVAIVASYAALALFALRNLRLAGMGVVAIGLALNIVPIVVDHGMPVRASAVVEAGIVSRRQQVATLDFGGKRHLETSRDRLTVLGDLLPDWVFHEVLSFGDLVMSVGIAAVFANLLKPPPPRRGRRERRSGPATGAGDAPGPDAPGAVAGGRAESALAFAMATIEAGPTHAETAAIASGAIPRWSGSNHPTVRFRVGQGPADSGRSEGAPLAEVSVQGVEGGAGGRFL